MAISSGYNVVRSLWKRTDYLVNDLGAFHYVASALLDGPAALES